MRYLIDSNVFISAKNSHYGMDFCPAFWDWVDRQHAEDRLHSVEKVGDELMLGKDRLADWAKHRGKDFFLPTDEATLNAYKVVSQWVHLQKYESAQENNFF